MMKIKLPVGVVVSLTSCLLCAADADPDSIVRDLKAAKPNARAHAAAEIGRLGPAGAETVPALIEALKDDSIAVRFEVINALEQIGPAARAAVPALIGILKEKQSRLTLAAISALGSIGHDAADAASELSGYLHVDDERFAEVAAFALARILPGDAGDLKPVIPVLIKSLQSKVRTFRNQAALGLMLIGPLAVTELTRSIDNYESDPQTAAAAAVVLQMMGALAQSGVPALIRALNSPHELLVIHAADALGSIGPGARDAAPGLQKLLQSDHALSRTHAAHDLGLLGQTGDQIVGDLTMALKDPDGNVRREAAGALGEIGPSAETAVPELIRALTDQPAVAVNAARALARIGDAATPALAAIIKDPRLARWAVVILGESGPSAAPAIAALRAALREADDDLGRDIVMTIGQIGPGADSATPELISILKDEDHKLRVPAAFALGNLHAPKAVPVLTEIVKKTDDNSELPLVAAGALLLIDSKNDEILNLAIPKITAALNNKSDLVRREAAAAIRQVGPRAAAAIPALQAGLQDSNPAVCIDCLWAITAIAAPKAAPKLVPEVTDLLTSAYAPVRYAACYAAGSLGPAAVDAVPILENYLQDADSMLQFASAWALIRIQGEQCSHIDECVDAFVRGLSQRDPRIRIESASTLGLIGASAHRALPVLAKFENDDDPDVRKAVREAIQKIRGSDKSNGKVSRSKSAPARSSR